MNPFSVSLRDVELTVDVGGAISRFVSDRGLEDLGVALDVVDLGLGVDFSSSVLESDISVSELTGSGDLDTISGVHTASFDSGSGESRVGNGVSKVSRGGEESEVGLSVLVEDTGTELSGLGGKDDLKMRSFSISAIRDKEKHEVEGGVSLVLLGLGKELREFVFSIEFTEFHESVQRLAAITTFVLHLVHGRHILGMSISGEIKTNLFR